MGTFLRLLVMMGLLAGCAVKQPLTHNYKGEIRLRSLIIDFQSLREAEAHQKSDFLETIGQVQKTIQDIHDVLDDTQRHAVMAQLTEFERVLVSGIKEKKNLPLVLPEVIEIDTIYNDKQELSQLVFYYPEYNGPTLDIQANIHYPETSSLSIGTQEVYNQTVTVAPQMELYLHGKNRRGETFWGHTVFFDSPTEYTIGNQYILGLAVNRIEEGQIFLLPLLRGALERL